MNNVLAVLLVYILIGFCYALMIVGIAVSHGLCRGWSRLRVFASFMVFLVIWPYWFVKGIQE